MEVRVACGGGGLFPPVEAALPPPHPTNEAAASNTGARKSAEVRVKRIAFTPRLLDLNLELGKNTSTRREEVAQRNAVEGPMGDEIKIHLSRQNLRVSNSDDAVI
jgi:hypothetical protein